MSAILCENIFKLFQLGGLERTKQLLELVDELWSHFIQHPATPESLQPVCDLERRLIAAKGPNKQTVEKSLFQGLSTIARRCAPEGPQTRRLTLEVSLPGRLADSWERQTCQMALMLVGLSREVLQLSLPRDSFSNMRKGLAFDILAVVATYYDIPGVMESCRLAISSSKRVLALAGLQFYQEFLRSRATSPSQEMLKLLDQAVLRTRDRSVAVTALNLQVVTGATSELDAVSRIDEWKERNRGRY